MISFLNDVDRIVARDYEPSDDDVVRARLRTMGVQEYHFSYTTNGTVRSDCLAPTLLTGFKVHGVTGSYLMSAVRVLQ